MESNFVHLRAHSEFSLVDGLLRVGPMVEQVARMGMPAVAITDVCNLFALIKFYRKARQAGLKPIVGCDISIRDNNQTDQVSELTLLVMDQLGYKNLTNLISRAWLEGQHQGRPYVDKQWLDTETCAGLIALSAGVQGELGQILLSQKPDSADEVLAQWQSLFPNRFYLELHRTGRAGEEEYLHRAVELAQRSGCAVVATNDVRFAVAEDFEAHEARVCIHDSRTLDDPRRPRT